MPQPTIVKHKNPNDTISLLPIIDPLAIAEERRQYVAGLMDRITSINPEVVIGHRNDLVTEGPNDQLSWNIEALKSHTDDMLTILANFVERREEYINNEFRIQQAMAAHTRPGRGPR